MYYYANAIPFGSFCFALVFIIYIFNSCKVFKVNDSFLWSVILIFLLFGGIGSCTVYSLNSWKIGLFRLLYLTYLSHYSLYIIPPWFHINLNDSMLYNYTEVSLCAYYSIWVVISFAILFGSIRTNLLFLLQCLLTFGFFLLRAVGEGSESLGTKRNAAGILQVIADFSQFNMMIFLKGNY